MLIQDKKKYFIIWFIIIVSITSIVIFYNTSINNSENNEQIKISAKDNNNSTILKELTTQQKVDDFMYMYQILVENYPYFDVNIRKTNINWINNKSTYLEKIKKTKTDEEFRNVLINILSELNNGHTNLLNESDYKNFREVYNNPSYFKAWYDILNKAEVENRYNNLEKIKSENFNSANAVYSNIPSSNIIIQNKLAYIHYDSFNSLNIERDKNLSIDFLNTIKDYPYLIIDIRGNGGGSTSYWEKNIVEPLINKSISVNFNYLMRGGEYSKDFTESKGIKLYDISTLDKNKTKNSKEEVFTEFKYYGESKFLINPQNSKGFNGKIFLLVDRTVYSAAEAFAVFCKSTNWATLVGERTRGDGIGSDPIIMALPNSGFVARFPGDYGLNPDGTANEEMQTMPDIEVDARVGQSVNSDKAIQTVIKLIENR